MSLKVRGAFNHPDCLLKWSDVEEFDTLFVISFVGHATIATSTVYHIMRFVLSFPELQHIFVLTQILL